MALCIGLTRRTDIAPPFALRYFLAAEDAAAAAELVAMRADPAFPLYQHAEVIEVAGVANPVPLPRRLLWAGSGQEYVLHLVPASGRRPQGKTKMDQSTKAIASEVLW